MVIGNLLFFLFMYHDFLFAIKWATDVSKFRLWIEVKRSKLKWSIFSYAQNMFLPKETVVGWLAHVLPMFYACSFHVLNWYFNEQSFVILWVRWWKNKCLWKRFTCIMYFKTDTYIIRIEISHKFFINLFLYHIHVQSYTGYIVDN